MKIKLAVLTCAALAAGVAMAGPHIIERADTDGDGQLSRAEFLAAHQQRAEEHFSRADTNNDGLLSADELRQAHPPRGPHGGMKGRRFEMLDTDGSGSISLAELRQKRPDTDETAFYAADEDGDGELSHREMRELVRGHRESRHN